MLIFPKTVLLSKYLIGFFNSLITTFISSPESHPDNEQILCIITVTDEIPNSKEQFYLRVFTEQSIESLSEIKNNSLAKLIFK